MPLDVSTPFASANPADMGLIDPVSLGEHGLRLLAASDGVDLFCSQSAVPMVEPVVMPMFVGCITVVVEDGSDAQMIRTHARRVIALVHDDPPRRDRTNKSPINEAMRLCALSVLSSTACDDSVAEGAPIPGPQPARRRFTNPSFNGYRSKDSRELVKSAEPSLGRIAQFAKIATERLAIAKTAFLFVLFHSCALVNGRAMTLP